MPIRPLLSVVVPTHDRPEALQRCLMRLVNQQCAIPWEIVVVDDGSGAHTPGMLCRIHGIGHCPARLLHGRRIGPAAARNDGWRTAEGGIVVFLDDDAFPERSDWLAQITLLLRLGQADVCYGPVEVPLPERPTDHQRNTAGLAGGQFLTANCAIERGALERLGGFDERFRYPFREDTDLEWRLRDAGCRFRWVDVARVIHPAPKGRLLDALRRQRYIDGDLLLRKKFPERCRETIRTPLHYYGMVALMVSFCFSYLADDMLFALVVFIAWLLLTLWFFLRRMRDTTRQPYYLLDLLLTSILLPFAAVWYRLRGAIRHRVVAL